MQDGFDSEISMKYRFEVKLSLNIEMERLASREILVTIIGSVELRG